MISITEAAERLAEIVEAQSRLIEKLIDAVGQFDEFENEVKNERGPSEVNYGA